MKYPNLVFCSIYYYYYYYYFIFIIIIIIIIIISNLILPGRILRINQWADFS